MLHGPLSTYKLKEQLPCWECCHPHLLFVCFRVNQHDLLLVVLPWDVNAVYPLSYSVASVYHGCSVHICIISIFFQTTKFCHFSICGNATRKRQKLFSWGEDGKEALYNCEFKFTYCSWISTMNLRVRCRPPWTIKIGGVIRVFSPHYPSRNCQLKICIWQVYGGKVLVHPRCLWPFLRLLHMATHPLCRVCH